MIGLGSHPAWFTPTTMLSITALRGTNTLVSEPLTRVNLTGSESQKFSLILPWLKHTLRLGGISSLFQALVENKGRLSPEEAQAALWLQEGCGEAGRRGLANGSSQDRGWLWT